MLVFRVLRARNGDGGFIGQLGEARSGVVGFNNSLPEASSGDGGFTVACISGCRGLIGFKVATRLRPVREKVRPASPKRPNNAVFRRAGRVFSRGNRWRGRVGRTLSRGMLDVARVGRILSPSPCRARYHAITRHNKIARRAAGRGWSGRRESNPPLKLGKLPFYR